jgi:S-adenosylmethionine:tRNA-ribosyltransferase-isomerase (queuine synthetase)
MRRVAHFRENESMMRYELLKQYLTTTIGGFNCVIFYEITLFLSNFHSPRSIHIPLLSIDGNFHSLLKNYKNTKTTFTCLAEYC